MIDRSTRKVGEFGTWGRDAGLPLLIRIANNGVRVRNVKIVANQGDAKWRIEMVQKHGTKLGNAVAIGVAQQGDTVFVLRLGAGEPLHPAGNDVFWSVNWRLWTIALDDQHISIGENVQRPRMHKAGRQCMDLQSLRRRGSLVFAPSDGFGDPYR